MSTKRVPTKAQPTPAQFSAFQQLFDYFNRNLFGGELPAVFLNFSRHANTYGFFAPERWGAITPSGKSKPSGKLTHEISINPTHLATRPLRDTASTLVHEMCHLWQHEQGSPPRRGYHDQQWAQQMLIVGLIPIDPTTGEPKMSAHKLTHEIDPSGAFASAFAKMPREYALPFECFEYDAAAARAKKASGGDGGEGEGEGEGGEGEAPKSRNKVKFTCPSCGANAWGKPTLLIKCGLDDSTFAIASPKGAA